MSDLMAQAELYQDAQDAVRKAQADLREARWDLAKGVLQEFGPENAIGMGLFTLNVSSLRRVLRNRRK